MTGIPKPPGGLSRWARGVWRELLTLNDFQPHEIVVFTRALSWWDAADAAAVKGDLKQAMDASATALRHWRVLKFATPGEPRRPGRPSGDEWSAKRKAQAAHAG